MNSNRLLDLSEELSKVEKMIELHSDDESAFMLLQYQARKKTLMKDLEALRHEEFLLSAPTFSKKQLDDIAATRKETNRWRKN